MSQETGATPAQGGPLSRRVNLQNTPDNPPRVVMLPEYPSPRLSCGNPSPGSSQACRRLATGTVAVARGDMAFHPGIARLGLLRARYPWAFALAAQARRLAAARSQDDRLNSSDVKD